MENERMQVPESFIFEKMGRMELALDLANRRIGELTTALRRAEANECSCKEEADADSE